MSVGSWFLIVSIWGALITCNAYLPNSRWQILAPSFFSQWLTIELAPLHLLWQLIATYLFISNGALDNTQGKIGLGITICSWIGILYIIQLAVRSRHVVHDATERLIGHSPEQWGSPRFSTVAGPLWMRDRKVERIKNLRYAPGMGSRHLLDVLRAKGTANTDRRPVLLQIHGGAWMIGDKRQQGIPLMQEMARRGWVCVAINYRLSPKSHLPAHLIDCKLALAWIREHIEEYGGDPRFVAVTGGSAGGHLTAMMALSQNDPAYQPEFETIDTSVQAAVPIYGVYSLIDLFAAPTKGAQRASDRMTRIISGTTVRENPALFESLSPTLQVSENSPPIFVIHGSKDTLVPVQQAHAFVAALQERSHKPVGYLELPGASHAFEIFPSVRTHHVVQGIAAFLEATYQNWCSESGIDKPTPPAATAITDVR